MATSKTLTPTNVTIQIPDFTEKPDQRVNSNCIDKEADAINALNTNMTSYVTGNPTSITLIPNTSYCSIISSYVYKLGRVVTVGLMIKFTATPPADTAYFISGFPIPNADVLVSCMKRNGGACYSCVLTQAGALRNEWQALPASQDCMFNFTYMASSLS